MKRALLAIASLFVAVSAWAATPSLTLSSASGAQGSAVTLSMAYDPGAASIAGIQFNLTLPAGLNSGTVTAGSIVTNAGKSVTTNLNGNVLTVIIFGLNQNTIPAGTLLTAQITIAGSASVGALNIPISAVSYTDPSGNVVPAGTSTGGAVTVTPAAPPPSIVLTKTSSAASAKSGDLVTFTIQYQNSSTGAANNVMITDAIPVGTTFKTGTIVGGGTLSGNIITWNLGTVAGGVTGLVSFQVQMN